MNFWTVEDTLKIDIPEGNLIEFGLYNGNTMERLVKGFPNKFKEVYGFDSFKGLPPEAIKDKNPDWREGSFNVVKDDNFVSIEAAKEFITDRVNHPNLHLVEGWFKETLTPDLGWKLYDTASYVHVDCDIFDSTLTCLDWLFKYNICKEGCVIRYDDYNSYSALGGQRTAHLLIQNKYVLYFTSVADNVYIYEGKL